MIHYRGAAYYPEFWPEDRWDEDVRLMKGAHLNIVRIGEFAWTAMEPAEGRFDFGWLHRVVEKLGRAGVNVLLCTPTAAPPAWLTKNYPDTLLVRKDGTRAMHGTRRHYCPTSDTFRRHSGRITEAMATDFARHKNVVAWQLDNEFGPEMSFCFCPNCTSRFRAWLRARYGDLDGLNRAWQTRFWSTVYTDWQEIDLRQGGGYPSVELDIRRFHSDAFCDFAAHQTAILRRLHPSAMVTTNMMGPIFTPINYYKMAELFDVVCDDLYFDIATMPADVAAMDVFRCMAPGKPFWITETGSGALSEDKGPYAEQLRAWAFSALAHGSEAHFIFRWRTCLAGQEQDLQGIVETSGRPRYRYAAIEKMFGELDRLQRTLRDMPLPQADVAILSSYDVHWAYESARIGAKTQWLRSLYQLHEMCWDRNTATDIIPPERDLAGYKLLILPTLCIVPPDLAERLKAFVRKGGVVLATPQLATRDANNNYVPRCAPDGLHDLLGLRVESHNYLSNANEADQALWVPQANMGTESVAVETDDGPVGRAERYMEDLEITTAKVYARYAENMYVDRPAVTINAFGRGAAFYTAAFFDAGLTGTVLDLALARAKVPQGSATPKYVEVVRRGHVVFAINHGRTPADVRMPGGRTVVGEVTDGVARLDAYGVCVVKAK